MASIRQTFPDMIHLGGGHFRLITDDARSWVRFSTNLSSDEHREIRIIGDTHQIISNMTLDGIIVRTAINN